MFFFLSRFSLGLSGGRSDCNSKGEEERKIEVRH